TYDRLKEVLSRMDKERGVGGNYLFYLATPPDFFAEITERLGAVGLTDESSGSWRRIIFEKPFGHDLESARELDRRVRRAPAGTQLPEVQPRRGKGVRPVALVLPGPPRLPARRSGTAATSTTSRSPWARRSASSSGPGTTRRRAACVTWCPTICSSCWP